MCEVEVITRWTPINDEEFAPDLISFVTTVLAVAKIHALAVHPDRQRKGYGTLLMRDAVNIARRGEMAMLYGQFGPQRNLRPFYSSLGFDVLSGEPLNVTMATGQANDYIACPPTETFIVKIFAR